jgi:hypothetical protein
VGAQKAGTSWLHDQLNRRKDADFGFCKEYHVFDALTLDAFSPISPPETRRPGAGARGVVSASFKIQLGISITSPGYSIDLAVDSAVTSPPRIHAWSANTLQWIRHAFRERSVRTCPVFILRDPIERLLSQQRMQLRKKKQLNPADEIQAFHKLAEKLERTPSLRSDYVRTLRSLDESFAKEDICLVLFEQLFDASSHQRLYEQLRLPYQPMDIAKKVNASVSTTPVPEEILSRIGKTQATTYRTLLREQPQLNLDRHWPTATQWCT